VTYRIQRLVEPDAVLLMLSGELVADHVAQLEALLRTEKPNRVRLDLEDVTLIDRIGVRFLVQAGEAGVILVNCPDYIRRWIDAGEQG